MNLVERHERADEAIRRLDAVLEEATDNTAEEREFVRPRRIQPLSDVDYGTVADCDRALVEVGDRVARIEEIDPHVLDDEATTAREAALEALRQLGRAVKEHRADLGVVEE